MKYLEAKRLGKAPEENKMQGGSLPAQRVPSEMSLETLAYQLGVKLATVTGTGENGEITAKDVRAQAKANKEKNQIERPVAGSKGTAVPKAAPLVSQPKTK